MVLLLHRTATKGGVELNHLARRGGVWWVRLTVPLKLRYLAGRREFFQSTRTHELAIAKLVGATLLANWRRQLFELECRPMTVDVLKLVDSASTLSGGHMSLDAASKACGIPIEQLLREASSGRIALWGRLPAVSGYVVPVRELDLNDDELGASGGYELPRPLPTEMPPGARDRMQSGILPLADSPVIANSIIAERLKVLDVLAFEMPDDPSVLFVPNEPTRIKVGKLEASTSELEALRRRLASEVTHDQVVRAQEAQAASIRVLEASKGKEAKRRFSEALEAYATAKDGIPGKVRSETEQKQKKRGCALFIELVGDLRLYEVSADRLREFREKLKAVPDRFNNIPKQYKRSTMADTVKAMREANFPWNFMSEGARYERMQWVDQMFKWLVAQGWLAENPVTAVLNEETKTAAERHAERRLKAQRRDNGEDDSDDREPFTDDELKRIFSQPQYKTGNGVHVKGNARWYPFEYWLPLIALHGGHRIKEVSQLWIGDLRQDVRGTWYFEINEITDDKSLKNENASRQIPIHPLLIEHGLIEYCERLKGEGYKRLFPELTWAKADAKYAKEPVRKMSDMFLGLGMVRDGTKVFHCLRANFNNAMKRVPVATLPFDNQDLITFAQMKIMGHDAGKNEANRKHYTNAYMSEKVKFVSGVKYDIPDVAKFDIEAGVKAVRLALSKKLGDRKGREDLGPMNKKFYG